MNTENTMRQLRDIATIHGRASNGAISCRRYVRRNRLPHQPAYRYSWFLNGNRISEKRAKEFLGASM